MKLERLSINEIAFIGYAVFEKDDASDYSSVLHEIGNTLEIDAVYGEGYDSTVFAVCCALMEYDQDLIEGIPQAHSRMIEALDCIGADPTVIKLVGLHEYEAAMTILKGRDDENSKMALDSIKTILSQHPTVAGW